MELPDFPAPGQPGRVALVGIGNVLHGDDAVGVEVVRRLQARHGLSEDVLLVEAGTAPENFTGPLRRFRPDVILLIDAASFDEPPGSIRAIDWTDTDGFSASTHTLPPSVFARFLVEELGCRLTLIGVQPAGLEFGQPLSPPAAAAADRLAGLLDAWLDDGIRRHDGAARERDH